MSATITPEERTYLAHLMSEMLAMENLPSDLRDALSAHLNKQLSPINLLKPEYCRRLYPILAELADLTSETEPMVDAAPESQPEADAPVQAVNGIAEGNEYQPAFGYQGD